MLLALFSPLPCVQVEVQEAYGKQSPQRYPLDPPDPKMVTGEDASTHNRGLGGPLAKLPLSVQPGEVLVQVCSRLPVNARLAMPCFPWSKATHVEDVDCLAACATLSFSCCVQLFLCVCFACHSAARCCCSSAAITAVILGKGFSRCYAVHSAHSACKRRASAAGAIVVLSLVCHNLPSALHTTTAHQLISQSGSQNSPCVWSQGMLGLNADILLSNIAFSCM